MKRERDAARGLVRGYPPEWYSEDIEIQVGPWKWVPLDTGTISTGVIMEQIRACIRYAVARDRSLRADAKRVREER